MNWIKSKIQSFVEKAKPKRGYGGLSVDFVVDGKQVHASYIKSL